MPKPRTLLDYNPDKDAENGITREYREDRVWSYITKPTGKIVQVCGATKPDGSPCMALPKAGNNRCRRHGGMSLKGTESPRFKSGKYSKVLHGVLGERYENLMNDSAALDDMTEEIKLAELRIMELLERLDIGESGEKWKKVGEAYLRANKFIKENNLDDFTVEFRKIGNLIKEGKADYNNWEEISKMIETKRKVNDSKRKHMTDMQQMMTADEARAMVIFIMSVVKENTDPEQMRKISDRVQQYIIDKRQR